MEAGKESERKGRGEESKGNMTVAEAGQKGGQRVKELIEEGKQAEQEQQSSRSGSSKSGSSGSGSSSKGSSSGKKDNR